MYDAQKNERYFMPEFEVFKSVIPAPDVTTRVSTFEHPIQSFVWDAFTAMPGYSYEYTFHHSAGCATGTSPKPGYRATATQRHSP